MPNILIRAHKSPFQTASAEQTISHNLLGRNAGNLIFSQAVCRLLSTEQTNVRTANLASLERLRNGRWRGEPIDRLVLPLANAFRPDYLDRLHRMTKIIKQAGIPVTVLGVGAQAALDGRRRAAARLDHAVSDFVRTVLRQATGPIGVRGEYTREYLSRLGFRGDDVRVIGCPSMFMYGPDLKISKAAPELSFDAPIALNISPYVRQMGPLSQRHATRYPKLIYIGQNEATLELLITGRYPAKPGSSTFTSGVPVTVDHPLIKQDRVRFFLDPTPWIDHLRDYQFSFGTRIHGNIAALLAGTPAVVLAHDSRTRELADYHRIPTRLITDRPDGIDAAELYRSADWQPLNDGHLERWRVFESFLHQHGLPTSYDDGEDRGAAFDARLASLDFPPAVRTPLGASAEELFAMRGELAELRRELQTVRQRLSASEKASRRRIDSEIVRLINAGRRLPPVANARRLAGDVRSRLAAR